MRDHEEQERGREAGKWGREEPFAWAVLTAAGMEGG